MVERVVAGEPRLELYRIDPATVVSNCTGETEKTWTHFRAAQASNAVLFFDDADRSSGSAPRSRAPTTIARTSRSPTCRKMERSDSAVILATDLLRNIDDAFLHSLDLAIEFPFPAPTSAGPFGGCCRSTHPLLTTLITVF